MPSHYSAIYGHIIFSTKRRVPWIERDMRDRLYGYIGGIVRAERGVLLAAGGVDDHVHLLVSFHPAKSASDMVRDIKANSSLWIHETFAHKLDFAWQTGYAAFSVSPSNLDEVRNYLATQEEHHKRLTFVQELRLFLEKHGVEYDPKYLEE